VSRCLGECKQYGYCSVDCSLAPWNLDMPYLHVRDPGSAFKLLLRFRRWVGHPISHRDVTWVRNPWRYIER
jgi:hypothetical protein